MSDGSWRQSNWVPLKGALQTPAEVANFGRPVEKLGHHLPDYDGFDGSELVMGNTNMPLKQNRALTWLIDSLPGIVFVATRVSSATGDVNWLMTYLSEGCVCLTGYRSDELVGDRAITTYTALTHPDDWPRVQQATQRAIAAQQSYGVEYRIRTRSGSEKWLWEKGYGVFDADGNLLSLEGLITDITDRKLAEEAFCSSEAQFRAIFQNAAIGIGSTSRDGYILRSNASLQRMLGYSAEELGQLCFADYTHPDDLTIDVTLYQELIDGTRDHYHLEKRYFRKDGQVLWAHLTVSAVRDAKGGFQFAFGMTEDITERKQAEESLRQAELKYRSIFENAVEGVFQTSIDGHYLTVNPMLARIYGYASPEELITSLTDIRQQLYVDPACRDRFAQLMRSQGFVQGFESQVYRRDGSTIWISESARLLYNERGDVVGYEGTVEDITQRKRVELELQQRDSLLQGLAEATNYLLTHPNLETAMPEVLAIIGQAARADRVSVCENHPHPKQGEAAMSLRFEWGASELARSDRANLQNVSYSAAGMANWYAAFSQGSSIVEQVQPGSQSQSPFLWQSGVCSILAVPVFVDAHLWGYIRFDQCQTERQWTAIEESIFIAIAANIGSAIKRQQTEAEMRHQAFHDDLTGLPNRALFNYRLPQAIDLARQEGQLLAVLFLDLDRFKTINDTLGHAVGDRLLQQVTDRLTSCLRREHTIARWGGDEFTVILPRIESAAEAAAVAKTISLSMKPAFYLEGHELHTTSSIGIALYPYNGKDAQTLLKNADAALYHAKAQGRNSFQFYHTTINSQATELLALDNNLHQALERDEFTVYYQPQINVVTGAVTQMEALLRWQHPRLGLVSPKTFISLAEENGLIVTIGEWVLRTACAQNTVWQAIGLPPVRVAVNLSARQFEQPNLVDRVAQILQETHLDPSYLELEITETAAMQDAEFTTHILHRLQAMGIRIAMDDFGTGYSSLTYLKKFPLDTLKIDQSFVRDLTKDADDMAIISAIITLAQGLDLTVVAEGVETQAQLETLRSLNCFEMQGYWFSPALDATAATEFLRQ
jgi:diguanylate cyclase (GGDEF)-like protein/PAS domain S-box-containing protein